MTKPLDELLVENLANKLTLLWEDWNKVNHHDHTNGLSQKAVNAYRHEHPGSKLKTAVTTKPSKLKAGSKAAKRRKSFCARMSGNKGPMKKPNGKPTPKALALRRWHCESLFELFVTAKKGIYEAEGDASGLKHLTPHLAKDILDQMEKEGVHAIVKSIEWGDGGAEELIAMIKRDLEQIANRVDESWSQKYKNSINCSHPKGFSQRAHCQGKRKHDESHEVMEHVCPDCGMCQAHGDNTLDEIAKGAKDSNGVSHCWTGYHAQGTKKGKNGGQVRNCVPNEGVAEGSEPQVGDAVYYGKRLVGWFKGYSEHGKIITEPNYEEMGDEYANRDVYWDPQDKITIKPEQGVAEGGGGQQAAIAIAKRESGKYTKDGRRMKENFADGRHPEDKGDSARLGIPKHASIASLKKIAHQGGRKGELAHWQANMRAGRQK